MASCQVIPKLALTANSQVSDDRTGFKQLTRAAEQLQTLAIPNEAAQQSSAWPT